MEHVIFYRLHLILKFGILIQIKLFLFQIVYCLELLLRYTRHKENKM